MNPLTQIKNTQKATAAEIKLGLSDTASWHHKFRNSAYIFTGGLDYELTEGDLLAVFAQYGEVVDVHLVRDKKTGKSRGFAFLAYEDQRSTVLSVDNLNGARVSGRVIRVEHVENYKKKRAELEGIDPDTIEEAAAAGSKGPNQVRPQDDGPSGPGRGRQQDIGPSGAGRAEQPKEEEILGLGTAGYDLLPEDDMGHKHGKQKKAKKDKKEKKEKKDKHKRRERHSSSSSSESDEGKAVKRSKHDRQPSRSPDRSHRQQRDERREEARGTHGGQSRDDPRGHRDSARDRDYERPRDAGRDGYRDSRDRGRDDRSYEAARYSRDSERDRRRD